jgi:hypothetical protein
VTEYQVRPLGKKCAATGADLVPGTVCWSALIDKDGELQRQDFSPEGWKGPPERAVASWKSVVPAAAEVRRNLYDPQTLMSFFEQLTEDAQPAQDPLRYVLALLLLQKRALRLDGSRDSEADEFLQLSGVHGEGAWEVRDPHLTDEEMHALQTELSARLAAEWGGG